MPKYEVRTLEWLQGFELVDEERPVSDVVSTHANYAESVAACNALSAKAWAVRGFNPFRHGGAALFFQSTFPPGPFRDYLQDRDLDVPRSRSEVTSVGWVRWYDSHRAKFTAPQLAALREAMNLVRFAEVVEVPDGAVPVYVVQELNWSWDQEATLEADAEGGNLVAAYRNRAAAEARCVELNDARRASPDYSGWPNFDTLNRRGATEPHDTACDETIFYEVVETQCLGLAAAARRVAVVYRQAVNRRGSVIGRNADCNDDRKVSEFASVVPVRAFADRAAADARTAESMRVARRTVNPFRVYANPRSTLARNLKIEFRVQPLPKWGHVEWLDWYSAEAPHLTDDQRAKFWSLFDDLPLYGVTDVPLG